jgi:hypothetical protein
MNNYYTIEPTPESSFGFPDGETNRKIQQDSGINSNWKYRQYMQKNANEIMKNNTMQTINASGNNPYTLLNTEASKNTPHLYRSIHDTNNPVNGFQQSDLKQDYMTKQQMKSRMIAPSIPTNF